MPVSTANKVPRPKGGKNHGGDIAGNTKVPEIERPAVTPLGRKVAMTFNWLQDEGVPMAKAIAKLRSVYNEASALGNNGLEDFFVYTSFFLQLPISSGTVKERMGKADEKILETICKFAVSFLQVLDYISLFRIFSKLISLIKKNLKIDTKIACYLIDFRKNKRPDKKEEKS